MTNFFNKTLEFAHIIPINIVMRNESYITHRPYIHLMAA